MREDGQPIICYVGIGSNEGEPVTQCLDSIDRISSLRGVTFLRKSLLYRTEPVGYQEQDWFINCVAEIKTLLSPYTLMQMLQGIESEMGRKWDRKWGPRIIDLDILLYGQEIIREEHLKIPHQELHLRRFVLVPLNEIASYAIHPLFGISIRGLLDRVEDKSSVQLLGR
ncbi:MAG: 2-amino-4-hydroxy-6-hydroxymethyldihydropteridine diphosphokinase [Deltaproteobacteria bacterium]|nr:2-amino-4-hydroxy-6-hydroxymethyldihydropteridine diphosphokinase [Deltaproteobacteria bacterium]